MRTQIEKETGGKNTGLRRRKRVCGKKRRLPISFAVFEKYV